MYHVVLLSQGQGFANWAGLGNLAGYPSNWANLGVNPALQQWGNQGLWGSQLWGQPWGQVPWNLGGQQWPGTFGGVGVLGNQPWGGQPWGRPAWKK